MTNEFLKDYTAENYAKWIRSRDLSWVAISQRAINSYKADIITREEFVTLCRIDNGHDKDSWEVARQILTQKEQEFVQNHKPGSHVPFI